MKKYKFGNSIVKPNKVKEFVINRDKDYLEEIERLNNIIGKAIGLIYDYQMNDEENVNYKELLYVLKGVDKE